MTGLARLLVAWAINAAALWVVADRLAQPEGTFRPFNRLGPFMLAYGRRENGRY